METTSRPLFLKPLLERARKVFTRAMIGVDFNSLAPHELVEQLAAESCCTLDLLVEQFERANKIAWNPLSKADPHLWAALKVHLEDLDDLGRIFQELLLFARGLAKL